MLMCMCGRWGCLNVFTASVNASTFFLPLLFVLFALSSTPTHPHASVQLADLPTSKHVVKVTVSSEGVKIEAEELKKMKRKRKRKEKQQERYMGKGSFLQGKRERATQEEEEEAKCRGRLKQGGRRMGSEEGEQKEQLSTCDTTGRRLKEVALCGKKRWVYV